jgi:hypothetical protein
MVKVVINIAVGVDSVFSLGHAISDNNKQMITNTDW